MPSDPWFPQVALATDPVAIHAGVVPTAKGARQVPAWRPPVGVGQESTESRDRWYDESVGAPPPQPSAVSSRGDSAPSDGGSLDAAARQVERETGIPASVLLAIPVNESGNSWGPGSTPYGIKAGAGWSGRTTGSVPTWEVYNGQRVNINDNFRTYSTPVEAMRDFANFLRSNSRYAGALKAFQQSGDPATLLYGLNHAGYATDPQWADKILNIMHRQSGGQSVTTPTYRGATGASQPSSPAVAGTEQTAATPARRTAPPPAEQVAKPKHWFTYVDDGQEVLKVINEDGGSTFKPTGRASQHPNGTVTNTGNLPVGQPLPADVAQHMPQWEKEAFYPPEGVGQGQDYTPPERDDWKFDPAQDLPVSQATQTPPEQTPLTTPPTLTPRDVVTGYQQTGAPIPTDVTHRAAAQFAQPERQTPETQEAPPPDPGIVDVAGRAIGFAGDVGAAASRYTMGALPAGESSPFYTGQPEEATLDPSIAIERAKQREQKDPIRAMASEYLLDPVNVIGGVAPAILGGTRALQWSHRLREALFAETPEGVGRVVPGLTRLISPEEYDALMLRYGPQAEKPPGIISGQFREVPPTATETVTPRGPMLPGAPETALPPEAQRGLAKVGERGLVASKPGTAIEPADAGDAARRVRVSEVPQPAPPRQIPRVVVPDYDGIHLQASQDPVARVVRAVTSRLPSSATREIRLDPTVAAAHPEGAKMVEADINAAARLREGRPAPGEQVASLYPGGWTQSLVDRKLREPFTDTLAAVETQDTYIRYRDLAIQRGLGLDTLKETDDGYRQMRMLSGHTGIAQAWAEEVARPIFQNYRITAGPEARSFEAYMRAYEYVQRTLTQDIVTNFHDAPTVKAAVMKVMEDYIAKNPRAKLEDILEAAANKYQRMQPQVVQAGRAVPIESGPAIGTDSRKAIEMLQTILDDAEAKFGHKSLRPIPPANLGPGLQLSAAPASVRARFAAAHRALSDALIPALRDAEQEGLLSTGAVDRMLAQHPVYTHIQTLGEHFDNWAKGEALPRSLPTSPIIKKEIGSGRLSDVSLDGLYARQSSLIQAVERQRIGNALEDWRQMDPEGFGKFMRPLNGGEMLNYHRNTYRPRPGMGLIPRFNNGRLQMYEVPKDFEDAVMGMNKKQTGWMVSGLSKFTRAVVGTYTAYSPSFIVNNFLRHELAAHHNFQAVTGIQLSRLKVLGLPTAPMPTENRLLLENILSSFWDSLTAGEKGQNFVSILKAGRMPTLEERAAMSAANPRAQLRRLGGEMYAKGYSYPTSVARVRDFEQYLPKDETPVQKAGRVLFNAAQPWKLLRAAAEVTEMATRTNIFKAALAAGLSEREAAYAGKTVTIDYQKGGSTIKAVNAVLPFINSRVQAIGRPLESLDKDPVKFAVQHAFTTVMPWAITYAMNRSSQWNDMYDRISRWEKQNYFIIPVGSYTLPNGQQNMLRLNIRKDESAMLITNLLEYMADQSNHMTYGGKPLEQAQRDERSPYQMWLQELRAMVPIPENPSESKRGWFGPLWSMVMDAPFVDLPVQMASNTDSFGQPIVPPGQQGLPAEFQYGNTYHPASALIAEQLGSLSQGKWQPSPASVSWLFDNFPVLSIAQGAGDMLVDALGVRPDTQPPAPRPGAPPTASLDQLANLQQQRALEDSRPWWAKLFPAVIRSSGGAQSLTAKLNDAPDNVRIPIEQSNQAASDYADWRMTVYYPQRQSVIDNPGLTGLQKRDQLSNLSQRRAQAFEDSYNKYPQAIKDWNSREKLKQQIPGIPVSVSDIASAADLNPQAQGQVKDAAAQYQMVGTSLQGQLPPAEVQKRQSQVIQNFAGMWGVDPAVARDAIKAQLNQLSMPVAGVPNAAIEQWVNRYLTPENEISYKELDSKGNPTGSDDPILLRRAQSREIERISMETGLSKDTVRQRISLRLSSPEEQTPEAASLSRAQDLVARAHDPTSFPAFIDPLTKKPLTRADGSPSGPEDWQHWAEQIGAAEAAKPAPRAPLPESIKHLVAAQAEGKRYMLKQGLWKDPQAYLDYLRWYGYGKNLTDSEWGDYLNGHQQRYKDVQASNITEATRRDMVIAESKVTPTVINKMLTQEQWDSLGYDEQQKRLRLRQEARLYARQAVPKWQDALKVDEVTPGKDDQGAIDELLAPGP